MSDPKPDQTAIRRPLDGSGMDCELVDSARLKTHTTTPPMKRRDWRFRQDATCTHGPVIRHQPACLWRNLVTSPPGKRGGKLLKPAAALEFALRARSSSCMACTGQPVLATSSRSRWPQEHGEQDDLDWLSPRRRIWSRCGWDTPDHDAAGAPASVERLRFPVPPAPPPRHADERTRRRRRRTAQFATQRVEDRLRREGTSGWKGPVMVRTLTGANSWEETTSYCTLRHCCRGACSRRCRRIWATLAWA
jgi:hypothetical protein